MSKDWNGANNPNWKGGVSIKSCIDCGNRISRNNKGGRCKSCAKKDSKNSFYGKVHSDTTKKQMAESNKFRDKSTYKGGSVSFETMSTAMRNRWKNASQEQKDKLIKPFIEAGLKASRKSSRTKIENIVNDILIENKFTFKRNHQIDLHNVDFVIGNKIIECYGDYWHCNPNLYSPDYINKSLKLTAFDKWEKDKCRQLNLETKGYNLLFLWETDIKNNKGLTEITILNFLRNE